jgi:hypothetical protein
LDGLGRFVLRFWNSSLVFHTFDMLLIVEVRDVPYGFSVQFLSRLLVFSLKF